MKPLPLRPAMRAVVMAVLVTAASACDFEAAEAPVEPATRIIVLVRHGHYDPDTDGKGLNALGREQAQLLADRLAREGWRFDSLHVSTLRRARETGEIVAKTLGMTPNEVADLSECTPPSRVEETMKGLEPGEAGECRDQLERAKARFLRPARGVVGRDLLICHGNVIRYLVARTLGLDPEAWQVMRITNAGITEIEVKENGELRLVSFNDSGHLPPEKRTMTGRPAPATH